MKAVDILIIAVLALIIGSVVFYIHRARKKGAKCIGCPSGSQCSGHCSGCSSCNCGK